MSTHFPDDDPLAAQLRDALSSEAAMVTPSDDGLQKIRDGIAEEDRPWWQHPATLAVAAAVVLGVAVGGGIAFLGGGDDDKGNVVAGTSDSPTASTSESPEPSDSPSPSESASAPSTTSSIYLYYAMDDGQSPRLYREVRPLGGTQPVNEMLLSMFAQPPADPDYASLWPRRTKVSDYRVDGDTATLDVSDFPSLGAEAEKVAVQQLVYTVTANDKSVKKVKLLVNGKAPPSGHSDWSQPVARAPMVEVQGLIWLLSPTEGETVSSPVTISGYGTAFEATINWEAYRDGEKVAEGNTQGGANGEFGEFTDTVELDPGTYELRAFDFSAKDGSPENVDTKTVTVE
jgi:germination protein M